MKPRGTAFDALVRALWPRPMTTQQIAEAAQEAGLGRCSHNTVTSVAIRLGLPSRRPVKDQLLRALSEQERQVFIKGLDELGC